MEIYSSAVGLTSSIWSCSFVFGFSSSSSPASFSSAVCFSLDFLSVSVLSGLSSLATSSLLSSCCDPGPNSSLSYNDQSPFTKQLLPYSTIIKVLLLISFILQKSKSFNYSDSALSYNDQSPFTDQILPYPTIIKVLY